MSRQQRFRPMIAVDWRGRTRVLVPFDPDQAWGAKPRHPVTGSVAGRPMRGNIEKRANRPVIALGPAWTCDPIGVRRRGRGWSSSLMGPSGPTSLPTRIVFDAEEGGLCVLREFRDERAEVKGGEIPRGALGVLGGERDAVALAHAPGGSRTPTATSWRSATGSPRTRQQCPPGSSSTAQPRHFVAGASSRKRRGT